MNRLWVRLSLMFSGVVLVFALVPLFAFLIFVVSNPPPDTTATGANPPVEQRPPRPDPWVQLSESLVRSFVLAGIFGVAGGIIASRLLAAPITRLADAAQAIGAGDLTTRVHIENNALEIEELAQAFNKMAADLQRAAELRNSLMADVSHELRTPLTVLEGNLRAALDHVYELDDEQIANLYQQTQHLIRLVNELRELALAEAAQLPLCIQEVDLASLVQETAAVFEPLAEEKGVTVATQIPAELPLIEVDRARLRQVLHNLLANALRHTPAGGAITISAQAEDGGMRLAVVDTGDGMEPQQLAHVFDRFYRTDPSRSRESGGSGLGLAIVKAIVEAHGGTVSAASAGPGKGSAFTICLFAAG
jgi:signal transduction histidine kinase